MYYRVGHFANPGAGDFTIQWESGPWGIYYNDGINPHIALNNRNQVVEVHQVPWEHHLHYWRGTVGSGQIQFVASQRYNNSALQPAVVLLDSGTVVEAHVNNSANEIIVTNGLLSQNNPGLIEWVSSVGLGRHGPTDIWYPALATDGTEVVATFGVKGSNTLRSAVGKICQPWYANGTLVKGSSAKVYVVLNNQRHWIPDEVTFLAMEYRYDNILLLSDEDLDFIPEGAPFPSVAPLSGSLRFANGTLFRGSNGNVYAVLNNHRRWIPDEATFEAMGYKWREIRQLRDNVLQAIPEMAPFPSVAR